MKHGGNSAGDVRASMANILKNTTTINKRYLPPPLSLTALQTNIELVSDWISQQKMNKNQDLNTTKIRDRQ